ncbi:MAG: BatA domain-containing protein [Candidatus Krumholzibacteria bacterium]|nr:BatA domain-containing protein [Candidatus Krumholzibacteria bacterium]
MFGLSFLNSMFLVGLVAAAVPVIIHLLNRRRVRRVRFSSLEFLDELNRRRMSKINLRRILILALRTLAVILLVAAFARPTLRGAFFLPGKAPKNVIICLDASYSMGVEQPRGTAFTLAKDVARQVVDEAGKNDAINLVVFAERSEARLERGTRNRSLVKSAIDEAAMTAETTSIRRAVDRAFSLIEESDVRGGEIYVVSDFRFNEDSVLVDPARARDDVRVYFLPVYEDDADNVSIDRVLVPRKLLRPGEVIRVSATVTNHARASAASFPLELFVDGARKAEKLIELAPSATASVTFPVSFTSWGAYRCVLAKNRDRLPVDDERYFILEVSRSVPVTLVRGRRRVGTAPDAPAAGFFYLEKALNPRTSGEGEFLVKTIDEKDVTAAALPAGGVVVWVDPQQLESNRLALLERYVRRGGGLMVFLGGSDRRLWQSHDFRTFLGMRSAAMRASDVQVGYTSFRQDHPVFAIFDDEELELLTRTRVSSYVSVTGVAPDSVIAYTGGGDPAIWECARGRGRVLVFAAAPDLETGDIPLSPMFLPLVHTSVSYLASAGGAQRQRENYAGRQLFFDTPTLAVVSSQLVVRDPGGRLIRPVVFETQPGEAQVICEQPAAVGFYELLRDTTVVARAPVNVDARESNVTARSLDGAADAGSVVGTGGDFAANLAAERQGREVFAVFVLLAAAALVAESILGRRV